MGYYDPHRAVISVTNKRAKRGAVKNLYVTDATPLQLSESPDNARAFPDYRQAMEAADLAAIYTRANDKAVNVFNERAEEMAKGAKKNPARRDKSPKWDSAKWWDEANYIKGLASDFKQGADTDGVRAMNNSVEVFGRYVTMQANSAKGQGFPVQAAAMKKAFSELKRRKNPAKKIGAGNRYAVVLQSVTGGTAEGYLKDWNNKGAVFGSTTAEALKTDMRTAKILGAAAYYFVVGEKFDKRYKIGVVNLGK